MAQVKRDRDLDATIKLSRDEARNLELFLLFTRQFRTDTIKSHKAVIDDMTEKENPSLINVQKNLQVLQGMDDLVEKIINGLREY